MVILDANSTPSKKSKQTWRPTVNVVFKLFITSNHTVCVHDYNFILELKIKIIVSDSCRRYIFWLLCQAADNVYEKWMKYAIKRK